MVGTLGTGEKWQLVRDPGASEVAVTSSTSPVVDAAVPEGPHSYVVRVLASDNSLVETSGSTAVTVDRTAPTAVAGAPDLQTASDSGSSSTDNITNVANPSFAIGVTGSLESGDRLELLRGATIVATGSAGPLVDTGAPEGSQSYTAKVTDVAGNGTSSAALPVTIDRTAAAPTVALAAASDTGRSNSDGITSVLNQATGTYGQTWTLAISGEPNAALTATRSVNGAAAAATTLTPTVLAAGGTVSASNALGNALPSLAPTNGTYAYFVRQTDVAGNQSAAPASPNATFTLDTVPPVAPVVGLDASTDTGPSSSDGVTRWDAAPLPLGGNGSVKINVTAAESNTIAQLWRNGALVTAPATPYVLAGTTGQFTDPGPFPYTGSHGYAAELADVAGNFSTGYLGPTVDLDNPTLPNKLDLDATSDTGTSDADDITNNRTPTFQVTGVEDTATVYLYRCNGAAACTTATRLSQGGGILASRVGPGPITAPVTPENSAANTSWRFTITQRDLSGRFSGGPVANGAAIEGAGMAVNINVVIDATPEPAPAAPVLLSSSQTGPGASAERTSAVSPTFNVSKGTGRVQLLRDGTVVGTSVGAGDITDPGPLANGTYRYTTRSVDTAGNVSAESAGTTVTIANGTGYWLLAQDGGVFSFGSAPFLGSTGDMKLNSPVMSMATTPNKDGYWLLAKDGGVFSFGEAGFFGSTGDQTLNSPIVGMVPTPSGKGYWLFAEDGGVFAFGDAPFHGSPASEAPTSPMAAMLATSDGTGYWLVTKDGKVYAYGTATALSGVDGTPLNFPIVGMAATPSGDGLWLVASDGGIFALGDAVFLGSAGDIQLNQAIIGMLALPDGRGYLLIARDGGVFTYGEAPFLGSTGGMPLNAPIVGIAGA
jgi:hypothetical protein